MRVHLVTISIAAAALAVAAAPAAAAETATVQKKAEPEKKICRLVEPPTGSMIKERVCLTEAEWKEVEKEWSR